MATLGTYNDSTVNSPTHKVSMAVHISHEQISGTSDSSDSSKISERIQTFVSVQITVSPSVVYELYQSESLPILDNILCEETFDRYLDYNYET